MTHDYMGMEREKGPTYAVLPRIFRAFDSIEDQKNVI
jgi:hypothetical protein